MASMLRSPGGGGTGGGGTGGGGGGSCFAGDTPVLTAEGWKPIEEVRAGDRVWSCDEESADDCSWRRVQQVLVHRDAEVWRLEVARADGGVVVVDITPNHPVYVAGLGWAEAGTLEVGDALVGADGEQLAVVGLWPLREGELVWNLTVAVGHTYFVGEGDGVWVHNKPARVPRPEAIYLGAKKHGVGWKEGPANAKSSGKPQGQWGPEDLASAGIDAATVGETGGYFRRPMSDSVVHLPEGGTVPAAGYWIRNQGNGTFHGYPIAADHPHLPAPD